jgi:hypothetical protein
MSGSNDGGLEAPGGYIRGGAGVPTDTRLVLRIVVAFCLVALAALTLALTVRAVHQDSRSHRLEHRGVAVAVTVTRCLGIASGTGITVTSFVCHGSFVLNGKRYDDVIGGTTTLHSPGDRLQGVVDPKSPSVLSTAHAVESPQSTVRPFVIAAIPAVALVLFAACAMWRFRRTSTLSD